jgi:hypothetical protein
MNPTKNDQATKTAQEQVGERTGCVSKYRFDGIRYEKSSLIVRERNRTTVGAKT